MMDLQLVTLDWQQTLPIRHQVLWPNESLEFCQVPGDIDALHFGVLNKSTLVCVASIYIDQDAKSARLRKFATLPLLQGKGVGSVMIEHLITILKRQGIDYLWFDARASALGFYQRFGFEAEGDIFYKNKVAYYKMHKHL